MIKDLALRQPIGLFRLSLIAIFVGIVTGIGAIAFRGLIGFIHNLFFLGRLSFFYDANSFTPPSPWGVFVILVPVVGALIVTLLVTKFAPEARGHGVPEVMDAIYYAEGRIRPVVAAVKSLASAVAIGTGSAVGREGPIIQIGASLGSTIGQIIPLAAWQRITLVAAGAGAEDVQHPLRLGGEVRLTCGQRRLGADDGADRPGGAGLLGVGANGVVK